MVFVSQSPSTRLLRHPAQANRSLSRDSQFQTVTCTMSELHRHCYSSTGRLIHCCLRCTHGRAATDACTHVSHVTVSICQHPFFLVYMPLCSPTSKACMAAVLSHEAVQHIAILVEQFAEIAAPHPRQPTHCSASREVSITACLHCWLCRLNRVN